MGRHLKRLAMPKTWPLPRKQTYWITKPLPSGHPIELCMPINLVLRDLLSITQTTKETKKLLVTQEILVDGNRVRDYKRAIGLFDRLYFPELNKCYTLILTKKNKLQLIELPKDQWNVKPLKIKKKVMVKKAKIQLTFHDGRTIFASNEFKVNDSVLFDIKNKKILKHLPLKKDALAYLIKGVHVGEIGKFIEIRVKGNKKFGVIKINKNLYEVLIDNLFIIDEATAKLIEKL